MMLKRSGRGHDPDGVEKTPMGGLSVECPACPHPSKNLPPNWENSGADVMYVCFYLEPQCVHDAILDGCIHCFSWWMLTSS